MRSILFPLVVLGIAALLWWLLAPEPEADVVLYCGVDQDQSQGIIEEYERETGARVVFVPEGERHRSIGLPRQLLEERDRPRADVYWSNEIMHMVDLGARGVLAPLPAGAPERFPAAWRDPQGQFVAFGARARVLLVNTRLLPDPKDRPARVQDLLDPKYKGMGLQTCMAEPFTGTTYTHAVALLTRDEAGAKAFFEATMDAVDDGRLRLAPGNGSAMQLARDPANKVAFCLTDTDDAWKAIQDGFPVQVLYPDQGEGQWGTVVMPNTAALVQNGPHPEAGARLLAWLTSPDGERRLANGPSAQIPLGSGSAGATLPEHVKRPGRDFRAADIDWQAVGANRDRWLDWLSATFRRAP